MLRYADAGSIPKTQRKARRASFSFAGWSITFEKYSIAADTTVVSAQEFARLEEWTKNPPLPAQGVLEGAELLRKLRG